MSPVNPRVRRHSGEWSIPVAGNAFRTAPGPGGSRFGEKKTLHLSRPDGVFSVFFHVNRPAKIALAVKGRALNGTSQVKAVLGNK